MSSATLSGHRLPPGPRRQPTERRGEGVLQAGPSARGVRPSPLGAPRHTPPASCPGSGAPCPAPLHPRSPITPVPLATLHPLHPRAPTPPHPCTPCPLCSPCTPAPSSATASLPAESQAAFPASGAESQILCPTATKGCPSFTWNLVLPRGGRGFALLSPAPHTAPSPHRGPGGTCSPPSAPPRTPPSLHRGTALCLFSAQSAEPGR